MPKLVQTAEDVLKSSSRYVGTLLDVSEEFGHSVETLKKWVVEGMPRELIRGNTWRYDLVAIARWIGRKEATDPRYRQDNLAELADAKSRKVIADMHVREAEAERKQLANARLKNQLLDKHGVETVISEMIVASRSIIEKIPEQLRPIFPNLHRANLTLEVRRHIERALNTLANWRPTKELLSGTGDMNLSSLPEEVRAELVRHSHLTAGQPKKGPR